MPTTTTRTVARFLGTCQSCGGTYKLTPSGALVHHGYERPGDGSIHGDCLGVYQRPYEETCEFTRKCLVSAVEGLADARKHLAALPKPPPFAGYPDQLPAYQAQQIIRSWERVIEHLEGMIARWEPRPIRTIEEVEGPKAAERAAVKAARDADRAAKQAAKIAKYAARIAAAYAKRNPRTLGEIYESAPQQLDALGSAEAVYAAIPGALEIFARFGLSCRARAPEDRAILDSMWWGLDTQSAHGIRWPEGA